MRANRLCCVDRQRLKRTGRYERFINRLVKKENGCIEYPFVEISGYARITIKGKRHRVHRFIYEYTYGPIPVGMCVCHKCDNTSCVNLDHLFLGTPKDNTRDCILKGRIATGENHGKTKLNWEKVREIRRRHALGESGLKLAKEFGVVYSNIYDIVKLKKWKETGIFSIV